MKLSKTDNFVGAMLMCGSMAGFSFNDAAMKIVADDISIYQAIFVRGLIVTIIIGLFAYFSGTFKNLPTLADNKRILWRSVAEVGATMCFLTALVHMPIANVTAVLQALPFCISIAAAIFLKEYFGWRRAIAIAIGFIGIMIIIRPTSAGFNSYSLLVLLAVAFVTWRDLIVRQFSQQVSTLFVAFVTAFVITIAGGCATLVTSGWHAISISSLIGLTFSALCIFVGYYFSIAAMRIGEVASVTPFRYTNIIWAILLGWVIWQDIPDLWTLIGILIVVFTGAYTLWRERLN